MTFTLLLLALFAERFLLQESQWRRAGWIDDLVERLRNARYGDWLLSHDGSVLALLALPLLAVGLLQHGLDELLWGLPGFAFALLVLLYCLGPEDLDNQVVDYLDSEDRGDTDKARLFAGRILGGEAAEPAGERAAQVSAAVLTQAQRRLFGVVFWFILLGPLGAVLYRLSAQLRQPSDDPELADYQQGVDRLLYILDWLPARLVAFSFALAGDYDRAMQAWARWREGDDIRNDNLLLAVGQAALGSGEKPADVDKNPVESAMTLVWRVLTLWLGVLALLAISG